MLTCHSSANRTYDVLEAYAAATDLYPAEIAGRDVLISGHGAFDPALKVKDSQEDFRRYAVETA